MMTEKGVLIVGVEHDGHKHKDFELRPQFVKDSVDALEEDERALRNDSYLGVCVLAKQITRLGNIPKKEINPKLLMEMYETDLSVISAAARRLQERMARFPGEDKDAKEDHPGSKEAGV